MCGGNGLYSYVLLDKNKVKAAPPSSSSPSSQQQQQPSSEPSEQPASPQIVTITQVCKSSSRSPSQNTILRILAYRIQ